MDILFSSVHGAAKNFLCFGDSKIRDELQDIIKLISKSNLVGAN